MGKRRFKRHLVAMSVLVVAIASTDAAAAQDNDHHVYHLPAQSLGDALRAVAVASGRAIGSPAALVSGKTSAALDGDFTTASAIKALLTGSGLRAQPVGAGFVIEPDDAASGPPQPAADDVVVTGSRIRGAPVASPLISVSARKSLDAGQASLGDIVRSIPQSYGGGQNPAIGFNVPATKGVNVGGGSSIDLRGLGSDATLTLLDGHRLSYSASRQSIDVSAIPLGAVDRIEIVPDGASSLYGSDAVAGVANIVLRKRYDGLETSARLGWATDGGDFEQRYGVTGGTHWSSGGVVASYEYAQATAITAGERSFASTTSPIVTLLPPTRNHSALVTANQDIADGLSLDVTGFFNKRWTTQTSATLALGNLYRFIYAFEDQSFAIAPTLNWQIGSWRTFLTGSYGSDHVHFTSTTATGATATVSPLSCYCNSAVAGEVGADGPLMRLGAQSIKLAVGAGYRSNNFERFQGTGNAQNVDRSQDSYYAYGELNLPLISADDHSSIGRRLNASAALRYERYPGIGEIVTPKLGLIYAPSDDVDLKGSWGRSFRAPTLQQQYMAPSILVIAPSTFGGAGYAAGATAFYVSGGNAALKPERASTWSATLDIHPRALAGASLALTYFNVDYRDRIVTPIAFSNQALSNPIYADRVTRSPNAAVLAALGNGQTIQYIGAGTYNPANVAVLIDNRSVNAGRQDAHGVDALLTYRIGLGLDDRALSLTADASYLDSSQQITAAQPTTPLAGQIFNPPNWRARGGADWNAGAFGASAYVNYAGPVRDSRYSPAPLVASLTSFDLSMRYRLPRGGLLGGISVIVSALDLFNAKPAQIATTTIGDAPFDSTNYSPVGRVAAVRIAKSW